MGGLLKNNSIVGILRYNGGTNGFTNANDLTHGVWYNQDNSGQISNMVYTHGYIIVYNPFGDSTIQLHISGDGHFTIRIKWGGSWYKTTFATV